MEGGFSWSIAVEVSLSVPLFPSPPSLLTQNRFVCWGGGITFFDSTDRKMNRALPRLVEGLLLPFPPLFVIESLRRVLESTAAAWPALSSFSQ